jgi:hypothetical protein
MRRDEEGQGKRGDSESLANFFGGKKTIEATKMDRKNIALVLSARS